MAKMKSDVVYLKDLVKRLDGVTLRDVAGLELKIQGWEWCDMEELVDLVVEHVTEDPLKALRYDLVLLPLELHEVYDEMVAGEAVEVSSIASSASSPTTARAWFSPMRILTTPLRLIRSWSTASRR